MDDAHTQLLLQSFGLKPEAIINVKSAALESLIKNFVESCYD